jgi:hypothetical protein
MTEHSQNGWTAAPNLATRRLVVDGVSFAPGIRDDDDVFTVLSYVVTQYAARVEPLRSPGCWGYSYRANRNAPDSLSNHASGTAVDVNAPAHPNDVPTARTFTPAQIAEVHRILLEVRSAVRWGGDYTHTPDSMHFELNCDAATLHEVAEELRGDMATSPKDWDADDWAAFDAHVWGHPIGKDKTRADKVLGLLKTWLTRQGK